MKDGRLLMLLVLITAFGLPKLIKFIYNYYRLEKELRRIENNEFDWSEV